MKNSRLYFLAGFCLLLIVSLVYSGFFQSQELSAYDWLMRFRLARSPSPQIAIIEISDDTLKGLGRWPIPREFHAVLIRALSESQCRMIIFDILFSEPAKADDLLAKAIRDSGKVYLPSAFLVEEKHRSTARFSDSSEILGGVTEVLRSSVKGLGHINVFVDTDGKVRRLPLWVSHAGKFFPALGFLAAVDYLGSDRRLNIPLDNRGNFWINYSGPWTKTFLHFSYLDVLKAYEAKKTGATAQFDLGVFKDKICFIGLTAAGTSDFRATPFDPVYPMVGTQASLCDSVLRRDFIQRPSPFIRSLIAVAIFLLACWVCLMFSPLKAFFLCCGLAAGYTLGAWSVFSFKGIFLDLFLPLASVGLVYGVVLSAKFLEEVQKRKILEKELEIAASIQRSFLPPDLRQLGNVRIRTFLKPAKFVGGDFYDIIAFDEQSFGFFIADVSGKGVSAALIMSQAISLLRVITQSQRDPAQVMYLLNNQLVHILKGRFVTGQFVVVHVKEGFWEGASAGHPPLILFDNAQGILQEVLPSSGPPLGLMGNISYQTVKRSFLPKDKIFMYTDGWTESRDPQGQEFGLSRFKGVIDNNRSQSLDVLLSGLESSHKEFERNSPQFDDLTAVFLELF
jgi:adenylate cyclase